MATFKHPDLPGQLVTYPDDAADILGASGWVNVNAPAPESEPDPVATHPDGEADDKSASKKK